MIQFHIKQVSWIFAELHQLDEPVYSCAISSQKGTAFRSLVARFLPSQNTLVYENIQSDIQCSFTVYLNARDVPLYPISGMFRPDFSPDHSPAADLPLSADRGRWRQSRNTNFISQETVQLSSSAMPWPGVADFGDKRSDRARTRKRSFYRHRGTVTEVPGSLNQARFIFLGTVYLFFQKEKKITQGCHKVAVWILLRDKRTLLKARR